MKENRCAKPPTKPAVDFSRKRNHTNIASLKIKPRRIIFGKTNHLREICLQFSASLSQHFSIVIMNKRTSAPRNEWLIFKVMQPAEIPGPKSPLFPRVHKSIKERYQHLLIADDKLFFCLQCPTSRYGVWTVTKPETCFGGAIHQRSSFAARWRCWSL